jgi:hypothetical protein
MRQPIIVAMLMVLLSGAPATATADAPTWPPLEVQERFVHCGYEASVPGALGAIPPTLLPRLTPIAPDDDVAVLVVRDPGEGLREDGRSVSVLVFPDQAHAAETFAQGTRLAAVADRLQAAARDPDAEAPTVGLADPDRGPPLLLGHGRSVWRGNVALAQLLTPPATLLPAVAAELERRGADAGPPTPADYAAALQAALAQLRPRRHVDPLAPLSAVDQDFVACLDSA